MIRFQDDLEDNPKVKPSDKKENLSDEDEEDESTLSNEDVLSVYNMAKNYRYDTKEHSWCEITFTVSYYQFLQVGSPLTYTHEADTLQIINANTNDEK